MGVGSWEIGDGSWEKSPLLGGAIESSDSIGVGHWELGDGSGAAMAWTGKRVFELYFLRTPISYLPSP